MSDVKLKSNIEVLQKLKYRQRHQWRERNGMNGDAKYRCHLDALKLRKMLRFIPFSYC